MSQNETSPDCRDESIGESTGYGWIRPDTPDAVLAKVDRKTRKTLARKDSSAFVLDGGWGSVVTGLGGALWLILDTVPDTLNAPIAGACAAMVASFFATGFAGRVVRRTRRNKVLEKTGLSDWIIPWNEMLPSPTKDLAEEWTYHNNVIWENSGKSREVYFAAYEEYLRSRNILHTAAFSGVTGVELDQVAKQERDRLRNIRESVVTTGTLPNLKATAQLNSRETLAQVRGQLDSIKLLYGAYLADPLEVLTYPSLNDLTQPTTAAFARAYQFATDLASYPNPDPGELRDAVLDAATTWAAAWQDAQRQSDTFLPDAQRDKLRKARALIATSLDPASSLSERETAYRKARDLLNGIVVMPRQALAAIERPLRALPVTS